MTEAKERQDPAPGESQAATETAPTSPSSPPPAAGAPENAEFAKLLESSEGARRHAQGSVVKGTIVQIGDSDALVDVGGRSEATIARAELLGPDGALLFNTGDLIEATVVAADGAVRLSRKMTSASAQRRDAAREMLMEAFRNHLPVSGRVTASVKGGYEVQVAGQRGFCPFSQIDVRRQEDPTLYFNKTFDFAIKEYDPRKRNLILSRRALLEAEAKKSEAETRARIVEGAVLDGTVVSIQDFGAFVELGPGVQGLLHVSEISHARVAHPKDTLTAGQPITVKVIKVDPKKGKISLSRKPLEADPWSDVTARFKPGQVLEAKVVRVAEFGAFVEMAPGVDGLLHATEMAPLRTSGGGPIRPQDLAKAGDEMKVAVLKVDAEKRRISLGLAGMESPGAPPAKLEPVKVGDIVTGKVEKVEKFGVFLRLGPGRTGLVPNNELGTPRGTDHRRMFPIGTEMTAEIIEADSAGRKIRLSVSKAEGREEREAVARYRKDVSRAGGESLSTLADAFAAFRKQPGGGSSGDR